MQQSVKLHAMRDLIYISLHHFLFCMRTGIICCVPIKICLMWALHFSFSLSKFSDGLEMSIMSLWDRPEVSIQQKRAEMHKIIILWLFEWKRDVCSLCRKFGLQKRRCDAMQPCILAFVMKRQAKGPSSWFFLNWQNAICIAHYEIRSLFSPRKPFNSMCAGWESGRNSMAFKQTKSHNNTALALYDGSSIQVAHSLARSLVRSLAYLFCSILQHQLLHFNNNYCYRISWQLLAVFCKSDTAYSVEQSNTRNTNVENERISTLFKVMWYVVYELKYQGDALNDSTRDWNCVARWYFFWKSHFMLKILNF